MTNDKRAIVGKLVTWACDRGNGWAALDAYGKQATYCYPIGVPLFREERR